MRVNYMVAALALSAASLAGCQQQQPEASAPETSAVESPATEAGALGAGALGAGATESSTAVRAAEANAPSSACPIIAHRGWQAVLTQRPGGASTLTISGQVDLPTPGYSVSFARDPNETPATAEPHLSLLLNPPTQPAASVVTAHPAYYFAPATGAYTLVHIMCEGEVLADINVSPAQ